MKKNSRKLAIGNTGQRSQPVTRPETSFGTSRGRSSRRPKRGARKARQMITLYGADVALLAPRSPKWPALRRKHLRREPFCRSCGQVLDLEVHHVRPVHLFPALELSPANLITLCSAPSRECHLIKGHLGNWWSWNPKVRSQCRKRKARPFHFNPPAVSNPNPTHTL